MRESKNRKRKVAVATVAMVLVGGTTAVAYWSSTGAGTGTATTGDVQALVVKQTSQVTGLAPGGAAKPLHGNFDNPNGGPVYVKSVTASIEPGGVAKASGAPAGTCDASDYEIVDPTMTVGKEVPAGSGQGSWDGAEVQFNNKNVNQDACKGATVTITYTAN